MKAYYNYSIDGFEERGKDILDINYGNGKIPLHIFRKDVKRFIRAIMSQEELETIHAELWLDGDGSEVVVRVLNELFKGRAMVLATQFRHYLEYMDDRQHDICKIAGLQIDGNINWEEAFPYDELTPTLDELSNTTK